jgi:hypothetical protein
MTSTTAAELQRLLGSAFESRGWEYDLTVGSRIVEEVKRRHGVDAQALALTIPRTWLARNGAALDEVAEAIGHAIGGRTPEPEEPATAVLNFDNRSYTLNLGQGAQIASSHVNVGGTQIDVHAEASRDEVLDAVAVLVRAGLTTGWNADVARELGGVIDARTDVGLVDVEAAVKDIVGAVSPEPGRARRMIESISSEGLGGALATGITTVVSALLQNPSF